MLTANFRLQRHSKYHEAKVIWQKEFPGIDIHSYFTESYSRRPAYEMLEKRGWRWSSKNGWQQQEAG